MAKLTHSTINYKATNCAYTKIIEGKEYLVIQKYSEENGSLSVTQIENSNNKLKLISP